MENRTNSLLPKDYYQRILEIKQRINDARFKSFRAVNTEMILMYLEIGKVISLKVSKGWGDSVVDKLSIDLQAEYPGVKGFSSRNLRRMKQIHEQCGENEIWSQLVAKLPWGHTGLIFSKCKKEDEIIFYLQSCVNRGWSRSVFEEEIRFDAFSKSQLFQNNFPKTIQGESNGRISS
jgi:predicted nuclease of restriction endonuclease-like (RecB) superfamily